MFLIEDIFIATATITINKIFIIAEEKKTFDLFIFTIPHSILNLK